MVTSFPSEPTPPDPPNDGHPPKTPPEPIPIDSARKTRLDREVDEILRSATRSNPLPPTPISSRRPKAAPTMAVSNRVHPALSTVMDTLMAVPLITAVGLGIACAIVAPYSKLLALVFAVLAVVVLVTPIVQAARRSSLPGNDGPKMWRGRSMDTPPTRLHGIGERTPADKITDWINSRRP
ncbi:MAG: hypothetical protein QM753_12655 [Thermomicrobiales bacterium]